MVRWNVARKAVSEDPVASTRPKRRAFNASTLRLLEELSAILLGPSSKIGIHFGIRIRTMNSGTNFGGNFLSSLRIDLEDLDGLQRSVLEDFARGVDY